jgi:hypothetical protein
MHAQVTTGANAHAERADPNFCCAVRFRDPIVALRRPEVSFLSASRVVRLRCAKKG